MFKPTKLQISKQKASGSIYDTRRNCDNSDSLSDSETESEIIDSENITADYGNSVINNSECNKLIGCLFESNNLDNLDNLVKRINVLNISNQESEDIGKGEITSEQKEVQETIQSIEFSKFSDLEEVRPTFYKENTIKTTNMAVVNLDEIFKSLRIPDAVKDLPNFDGNPRTLYDFISNVEEILGLLSGIDGTNYGKLILRAIRNKIIGSANEVLNLYGTPTKWDDIKNNLIIHYSDKRNETSLIRNLHLLRQNNDTIEQFYSKIVEILSTMINHINVHEKNDRVIEAKQKLYEEMCLNTFLSGLKEPLGSTVRAMRPGKLAEALNYCLEEQNTHYVRNSLHRPTIHIRRPPTKSSQSQQNYNSPPRFNSYQVPRFNPQASRFNSSQRLRFNPAQTSQFTSPNFSQLQQRFQPGPSNQQLNLQRNQQIFSTGPEPMDTSSGNTNLNKFTPRQNNFFRSSGPPRFISEELFNVESNNRELNPNQSQEEGQEDKFYPETYRQSLDAWHDQNDQASNDQIDDTNFH